MKLSTFVGRLARLRQAHMAEVSLLLAAACVGCAVALLYFTLFPPHVAIQLDPRAIVADQGRAYLVPAPRSGFEPFATLLDDAEKAPDRSELRLFENGLPIGRPHLLHQDIRRGAKVGYSHWARHILFVSLDGSDPRSNGKTYSISSAVRLKPIITWGVIGVFLLSVLHFPWSRALALRAVRAARDGIAGAGAKSEIPRRMKFAGPIVGALAGLGVYLFHLATGATSQQGFGGVFQLSDAAGYLNCATQLLEHGANGAWCHRRPIYSAEFAGLSLLAWRNIELTLMLQAALIGIATYVSTRELARWLGPLYAAFFALAVFWFSWTATLGQTMSEFSGLIFGLLAVPFLLRGAEQKNIYACAFGIFMLGVALNARPAGLLALPLIVLWLAGFAYVLRLGVMKAIAAAIVAVAGGFLVHSALLWALHADGGSSFGNFSATLYGLSVNGTWRTIYELRPEMHKDSAENFAEIYRLAFVNIRQDPVTFLVGMLTNIAMYVDALPFLSWAGPAKRLVYVVMLGGVVLAALRSWRAALVLAVMLGELLSSTLLGRDSELRIWAGTFPLGQAAPVLVAIHYLVSRFHVLTVPETVRRAAFPRVASAIAALLGVATILPFTPLPALTDSPYRSESTVCGPSERKFVINVANGGVQLNLSKNASPSSFPRRMSPETLRDGINENLWQSLPDFPEGTLIEAYAENVELRPLVFLYAPPDLNMPMDRRVAVCVAESSGLLIETLEFGLIRAYRLASD